MKTNQKRIDRKKWPDDVGFYGFTVGISNDPVLKRTTTRLRNWVYFSSIYSRTKFNCKQDTHFTGFMLEEEIVASFWWFFFFIIKK